MNELRPNHKASRVRKRKGRGIGTGNGKTAGRGMNGQRSRTGASIPAGFEGGQMPLYRRVPKRGFTNIFKKDLNEINVSTLNKTLGSARHQALSTVTTLGREQLVQLGLVKKKGAPVKLLGTADEDLGNLKGKTIVVNSVTVSGKEKLKSAGITVTEEKFVTVKPGKKEVVAE